MKYKYYSTQRPISLGTFPTSGEPEKVEITNFDLRGFCPEINRNAWGYIVYERKLSEREMKNYELVFAGTF